MTILLRQRRLLLATLILSLGLAGCSTTSPQAPETNPEPEQTSGNASNGTSDSPSSPRIEPTPLTGQSFYQLLLAEIATNRRDFGTAAELYSRLSDTSDDIEVARRATALNQVVGNYGRMQTHARKWADLSPGTVEAWQALGIASLANGDFDTGETALGEWLGRAPDAEVETALVGVQELTAEQQQPLTDLLERLFEQFPDNGSLPFAAAQVHANQADYGAALPLVREARALDDSPDRGLLEYRVLLGMNDVESARTTLEELAAQYPDSSEVATAYASFAYADQGQDRGAVLASLFNRFPNEPVIVRAFARESFDNGDYDTAQALFERLVDTDIHDEAHYFLGRINVENARPELAAEHFLSVDAPPYLISALAELGELWRQDRLDDLLAQLAQARERFPDQVPVLRRIEADAYRARDELENAFDALEQGLERHPNNTSLLYDQALVAGSLDRFEVLENNLRTVLQSEPDNASALNALGYTWADRDENLAQAEDYINRALEQRPDDPAIMDSKGWVEYRLGNLEEAERWLRQALDEFDNDEVAAHLAEVLWVQDERDEARKWLRHAFDLNPESPTANAVVEKFGVDL